MLLAIAWDVEEVEMCANRQSMAAQHERDYYRRANYYSGEIAVHVLNAQLSLLNDPNLLK
jgi:hypothetical protein